MFVVLSAVWLLWSGSLHPLFLGFGALSIALALVLASRMGCLSKDVFALHLIPRLPGYLLFVFVEIVRSSIYVSRIVLSPRIRISPTLVRLDVSRLDTLGIAILGNSITVTPNTATIDVSNRSLLAHCLTAENARSLSGAGLVERVLRVTGEQSASKPNDGSAHSVAPGQNEPE
jgi:multicomponent Na+:H+ antiporter subunit E